MADATRERDRAVRIAYAHARRGDDDACTAWIDVAGSFARPTEKQLAHARRLLRAAGPFVHAGQLELEHAMMAAQTAQARAAGYRDAASRYG